MSFTYTPQVSRTNASSTFTTIADVKNFIKQGADVSVENDLITAMMEAAEEWVEEYCDLCINDKDVTVYYVELYREFIADQIKFDLPYRGTRSSLVVKSIVKGAETTLTINDDYRIEGENTLRILTTPTDINNTQYLVTYSVTAATIPKMLTQALYKLVADMYVNRNNESINPVNHITNGTRQVLNQFRKTAMVI